jgi:hypothetical protein
LTRRCWCHISLLIIGRESGLLAPCQVKEPRSGQVQVGWMAWAQCSCSQMTHLCCSRHSPLRSISSSCFNLTYNLAVGSIIMWSRGSCEIVPASYGTILKPSSNMTWYCMEMEPVNLFSTSTQLERNQISKNS